MKKVLIILLMTFTFTGFGQNKGLDAPCNVNSNFSKTQVDCDTFTFNTSSTASNGTTIVGYFWNFGDGSTSTVQNPTHSYSSNGTYTVTLTTVGVTNNGNCCTDNQTMQVIVDCSVNNCGVINDFRDLNQMCSPYVTYYIPLNGLIINSGWTINSYDWTFIANNGYTVTATGVQPTVNLSDYFCNCPWSTTLVVTATNQQGVTCILSKTIDLFSGGSDLAPGCTGSNGSDTINSNLSVYPNPVKDVLNINLSETSRTPNSTGTINLIDFSGNITKSINSDYNKSSYTLDVSNIEKGIYFLQFISNGQIIQTEKIIVK